MQIQKYFSKCESYLRERERERETERDRERETKTSGERGCKERVWCAPSLTDTQISGDSSLVQPVSWRQLTATFVLVWPIALKKDCQKWKITRSFFGAWGIINQLLVFSHCRADTVWYCHTRGVRNGKYITWDGVAPTHPLNGVMWRWWSWKLGQCYRNLVIH